LIWSENLFGGSVHAKRLPRLLRLLNDELGYTVREGNPSLGYSITTPTCPPGNCA